MLLIEQLKKIDPASGLSDTELEEIRDSFYESARLAFEIYWSDRNSGSKNPLGLLSTSSTDDMV